MKNIKITDKKITMGIFVALALHLAPIIAGFVAEIIYTTKTPAIKAAPPPVVH